MTASIEQQIIDRVQALLVGNTDAGANVFQSIEDALSRSESPAIVVMPSQLAANTRGDIADDIAFEAYVVILVRGDPWVRIADAIAAKAQQLIKADAQLFNPDGASLCDSVRRISGQWSGQSADQTIGQYTVTYRFRYLADARDPTRSPPPF